ncbi:MAG: ComEC/Rec2 family competence protein [Bacteroides sp.]|nr:ComEC/Rec2 family competence protein [Bacteroides sp.]
MDTGLLARVPALPLAAGIVAGIPAATLCPQWWAAPAVAAAGALILILLRLHAGTALIGLALGMAAATLARDTPVPPEWHSDGDAVFSAVCTRGGVGYAEVRIDTVTRGRSAPEAVRLRAVVWHPAGEAELAEGYRYRLRGSIKPLRTIADVPYQLIPRAGAISRGAAAEIQLSTAPELRLDTPPAATARIKERLRRALIEGGADDRAYATYSAILLAERDVLDSDLRDRYAAAGIAHILALSGFHVGFIALIAALILFPLNLFPRLRPLKYAGIVAAIWAFAWLTGMGASVTRAAIMATVLYTGHIVGREVSPWNSLCVAVAVILLVWPAQLVAPGFQLSVAAVASLLAFVPLLNPVDPRRRLPYICAQAVAVPVAAMGGTMAVTALWFHALPVYFLPCNVAVALVFPLLMTAGLLTMLCGLVGVAMPAVYSCANGMCAALDSLAAHVSSWPGAVASRLFIEPVTAVGALVFLGVCALLLHRPGRRALMYAAPAGCAALIAAVACTRELPADEACAVPLGSCTSVVVSCGGRVCAFTTAAPRYAPAAERRLRLSLADYTSLRGADSITVIGGDFTFGPYSRRGEMFSGRRMRVAIPTGRRPSAATAAVSHLLLTNRCTAPAAAVLDSLRPDTLVISCDVSLRRRRDYEAESRARGIPAVCLDTAVFRIE